MPYAIMEFGPTGHWAAPVTEWGAVIEESSSQKVPRYNATCHTCYDDPRCPGASAVVRGRVALGLGVGRWSFSSGRRQRVSSSMLASAARTTPARSKMRRLHFGRSLSLGGLFPRLRALPKCAPAGAVGTWASGAPVSPLVLQ